MAEFQDAKQINGDLIGREALLKEFKSHISAAENARDFRAADAWRGALWDAQEAPAVDAAPVVHGRWIESKGAIRCSECMNSPLYDYHGRLALSTSCPNCGAKMDG